MTSATMTTSKSSSELARTHRRRNRSRTVQALRFIAILPLAAFAVIPFLWMLRTALTPTAETFSTSPSFLPDTLTLENFIRVVTSETNPFIQQFTNTVLVSLGATVLAVVVGVSGAFALARLPFKGRGPVGMGLLMVQFFPPVLLVIPLFVVLSNLGLTNSLVGLVIAYTALTLPFTIWILRGYLSSLPVEIEEAARVDGCSYVGVLFRIVLPAIRPALAVVATLAFVNAWNEYLLALVLVTDPDKQVLGIGLTSYVSQFGTDYAGLFAMATITTLPVVLVFLIFQRAIVGGLSAGAVK